MPKLSEPMRAALETAERHGPLRCVFGLWKADIDRAASWIDQRTINALVSRGLLRHDGATRVITADGREAIGKTGTNNG
jgi:hypothetical protein